MDLDDEELWYTKFKKNYVSKDKLKELIKDLEEFDTTFYNAEELKLATINSINELLGE